MTPDPLHVRGYNSERDRAARNLRRALEEVQAKTAEVLRRLDSPTLGGFGTSARLLAGAAGEAAQFAGALDMARDLAFLVEELED